MISLAVRAGGLAGSLALFSSEMMPLLIIIPDKTACEMLCANWRALVLVFSISFAGFISLFILAEAWHCWHECTHKRKQCTRAKMESGRVRPVGDHQEEVSVLPELLVTVLPPWRSRAASSTTLQAAPRQIKRSLSSDSLMQRKPIQPFLSQQPNKLRSWQSNPLISFVDTVNQNKRKTQISDADCARLPVSVSVAAKPAQYQRVSGEEFFFDDVHVPCPRSPSRSSHKTSAGNKFYATIVYRQRLQAASCKNMITTNQASAPCKDLRNGASEGARREGAQRDGAPPPSPSFSLLPHHWGEA